MNANERAKKHIHVTYTKEGRPIKYTRTFCTELFRTEITLVAEYLDGSWHSHMILPPTGDKPILVALTGDEYREDEYFSFNELSQLLKEAQKFNRQILDLHNLEISVHILDGSNNIQSE